MVDNYTVFTVNTEDGKGIPVGVIGLYPNGYLSFLLVDSEYRRKGVGIKLLATAEDEAKRRGIPLLSSATHGTNIPTINLLKKCGFNIQDGENGFVRGFKNIKEND